MAESTISKTSPCEDGYIYIPVAFVIMLYLVYLVECWHSHTRIELHHKVDVHTVYDKIKNMTEAIPILWWKALCYHYVRKTRHVTRYRNGDSFTTTQVYYERVNTHTSGSAFNFSHCGLKDMSTNLKGLEDYPATKIRFSKGFSFANIESECEFDDQRSRFFRENERRDDYIETREGLDLLNCNFKEYMITFTDPDNLPWYVSAVIFWVCSCLLLSWPLRVIIEYKTAYVHYHVHKLFGGNYSESEVSSSELRRVDTVASRDLELTIQNNYALIPSYSEALLLGSGVQYNEIPDANGNVHSSIYGAKRSMTYGSLSSTSKQDSIQRFPPGIISSQMRRCHSYTIIDGGLVIQGDMQNESTYANRSRRKSNRSSGLWRLGDSTSSRMHSPTTPTAQECVVAINPQTSTVRFLGLDRDRHTSNHQKLPLENPSSRSLIMSRRADTFSLRSPSAFSLGLPSSKSQFSMSSPHGYDDAIDMDIPGSRVTPPPLPAPPRPLPTNPFRPLPPVNASVGGANESTSPVRSNRQVCRTIMETSL